MVVSLAIVFALFITCQGEERITEPGCNYNKPYPMVFDGTTQPEGDIYSPGFRNGKYPNGLFCGYAIKAPPGQIVKLTFKEMEIQAAGRCSKDKVFVVDGPSESGGDLGVFCGLEPPSHPIVSTSNGMFLSFRTDEVIGKKGFHAHYQVLKPEDICPQGYSKCTNNNCYRPNQKCDGEDDCGDGSDEENCNRPLPTTSCGSGNILPIETADFPDRIVGGIEAKPGSFPWQVDLHIEKIYPDNHICGGTILNAEWVMTAQHCLGSGAYARNWRVIVGNHDRYRKDTDEQFRYVKRLVVFPGLTDDEILGKPIDIDNDIALMQLNAPVKFSDRVRPACLPPQGYELPLRTKCIISGWGETRGSGYDHVLKQAEVYTKTENFCNSFTNATMICVRSEKGIQDACHGDSGGPLSCKIGDKYHVTGITSFGSSHNMMSGICAVSKLGTVFNKVSAKTNWINDMIKRFS